MDNDGITHLKGAVEWMQWKADCQEGSRAMSIAKTHAETALLWLMHAAEARIKTEPSLENE